MKKVVSGLKPAAVAAMLRSEAFALKPREIGLSPEECPQVWGLILELGFSDTVASLVVLNDGSVSVYLSDGGGVIGCGLHPDVRRAALKMLLIAQGLTTYCRTTSDHPLPAESQVYFYLFTPGGTIGAQADKAALDDGALELAELYYAAHGLIDIIELLGAGIDLIDEMRLAQNTALLADDANDDIGGTTLSELKARGRACRILPYAGSAARRSQN